MSLLSNRQGALAGLLIVFSVVITFLLLKNDGDVVEDLENVSGSQAGLPIFDDKNSSSPAGSSLALSPLQTLLKKTGEGKVVSIVHGGSYSFVEVLVNTNKVAVIALSALPKEVNLGDTIRWRHAKLASNYYSHALNQKFDRLYMATLAREPSQQTSGLVKSVNQSELFTVIQVITDNEPLTLIIDTPKVTSSITPDSHIEWGLRSEPQDVVEQHEKANSQQRRLVHIEWLRVISS